MAKIPCLSALLILTVTLQANASEWVDLGELSAWRAPQEGWSEAAGTAVDGKELSVTKKGRGCLVVPGDATDRSVSYLLSKKTHGDIEAHIEFMVPAGSNSGIYFMGRYEIQILDSYGKEKVTSGDCGGIYQRWGEFKDEGHAPRVNAAAKPGQWQTFDVVFRAPRFDETGNKVADARFEKVVHNGVLIHENVAVTGPTRSAMAEREPEEPAGPLRLQGNHGPVAYRAIRFRALEPKP